MQKIAPEDPTPSNDKFPSFPQIRYIPPEIAPTVTPSFRFFGVRIKDHPENEPLVAPAPTAVQSSISDDEDLDDEDVQERPRFIQPTEVVFKKGRVAGLAIDPDLLGLIQEQQTSQHLCRVGHLIESVWESNNFKIFASSAALTVRSKLVWI